MPTRTPSPTGSLLKEQSNASRRGPPPPARGRGSRPREAGLFRLTRTRASGAAPNSRRGADPSGRLVKRADSRRRLVRHDRLRLPHLFRAFSTTPPAANSISISTSRPPDGSGRPDAPNALTAAIAVSTTTAIFRSSITHADVVSAGCLVHENGVPPSRIKPVHPTGASHSRPLGILRFQDTWHTTGLRGTGGGTTTA